MRGDGRLVNMKANVNGRLGGIEAGACGAYGAYGAAFLSTFYNVHCTYVRVRYGRTMYEFGCAKFQRTYVVPPRKARLLCKLQGVYLLTASLRGPGTK